MKRPSLSAGMLGFLVVVAFVRVVVDRRKSALLQVGYSFLNNLFDAFGKLPTGNEPPKITIAWHCRFLFARCLSSIRQVAGSSKERLPPRRDQITSSGGPVESCRFAPGPGFRSEAGSFKGRIKTDSPRGNPVAQRASVRSRRRQGPHSNKAKSAVTPHFGASDHKSHQSVHFPHHVVWPIRLLSDQIWQSNSALEQPLPRPSFHCSRIARASRLTQGRFLDWRRSSVTPPSSEVE